MYGYLIGGTPCQQKGRLIRISASKNKDEKEYMKSKEKAHKKSTTAKQTLGLRRTDADNLNVGIQNIYSHI
jgi:hypothetical protein